METTHEPLYLDKWSLVQYKITDIPTNFIWVTVLFYEAPNYGDGAKFWGYVGTNAEITLYITLVQCRILKYSYALLVCLYTCIVFPFDNFEPTGFLYLLTIGQLTKLLMVGNYHFQMW
jgi:hypothetical protein